ncbi:hypothetical protein [Halarsenatibacter silvermanii]|uniref:Uncharacterized protein n=1 Tax=Halarsenatibacter silvermanii TaxID=321763 RepID=A0A1G9RXQ9_9FIRM|nr:hypothetical protein [Halarsenatibacter silvermanii]SDM27275.1 hypothetical protein SAMN04488692_12423 [Halarsenatibacter silvermanii]
MRCTRCGSEDIIKENEIDSVIDDEILKVCDSCGHSWWSYINSSAKS